jgi:hypothetical protein
VWGHRKIAAMMRADGHPVSTSTVERALRRRGPLLPRGFRADRKSWVALRRKVFYDPPTERNRIWQTDFSEFETTGGGIVLPRLSAKSWSPRSRTSRTYPELMIPVPPMNSTSRALVRRAYGRAPARQPRPRSQCRSGPLVAPGAC